MDKSRLQLVQLCQSFQLLFQKLKDNRKHKLEIEKSNDQLRELIRSETEKTEQTSNILNQERDQLDKQLKQVQEILEAFQSSNIQIIQAISVSTSQQKLLLEQKKNLEEGLKEKENIIHDKLQQQSFLKEEMNILCRQINLLNGNEKDLEGAVQSLMDNLELQKSKLNEQLSKIQESDGLQVQIQQERDKSEMNYKMVQKELAMTIKQNALVQQKIKECTKVFEKLSQQLNSKIERLNTQHKHNDQLNQQIKKLENLKISQQNVKNLHLNSNYFVIFTFQQYHKSLQLIIILIYQYQQSGQQLQQQSLMSKNLSPNSRIRMTKQKQAFQAEQQLQEEQRMRVNEYRQQLTQQLEYYRTQIENFDAMINQLQQDIENLQSQFEQYTFIPQEQLIQLFQQHFLAQNTNEEQEYYQEQDLNHLQQMNYESFNPQHHGNGFIPQDENHQRHIQGNSQVLTSQQNYSDGIFQQEEEVEEVI